MKQATIIPTTVLFLLFGTGPQLFAENSTAKRTAAPPRAKIWRDPGDVSTLNFFYGAGGRSRAPSMNGRYVFYKVAKRGASPKFDVKDEHGVIWRVKLGEEARTETAATRLLWGAGYFVDEDYYLPKIKVSGVPKKFLSEDGTVTAVRMERRGKDHKDIGEWEWERNPFVGTREFNGLRVMMALLNNWDLKTSNNSIMLKGGEKHYMVSDVGATFGKTGGVGDRTKGRLHDYSTSKFIDETEPKEVDLTLKSRPPFLLAIDFYHYQKLADRAKVGKNIPRPHAKWLGQRLARISDGQLSDCFRSAGFSPAEVQGYTKAVRKRIAELNAL
ncbi:MAG TPA: hypothetical protein VM120_23190 [Bryobacteraceae bacterium]|nr:hypothetical protein [Bryobacteraceae bacterium]